MVIRLTGGAMPTLGDLADYQASHQALFRDAPFYGWVNVKAFVDTLSRKPAETKRRLTRPTRWSRSRAE